MSVSAGGRSSQRLLLVVRSCTSDCAPGSRYGGWESPNYQWGLLNGHFTGHLLSALAFDAAGTDSSSAVTAAKGDSLVAELAKCQAAVAKAHPERAGWLSAYSIAQMDRLDAHNT